jgi:DUF4097 and DUF4098 domain-containing protein YvlB
MMRDKLKDFVEHNREGFDDLVPTDLWTKIDTGIKYKSALFKIKSISNMFKFGFGASALVIGTVLLINSQKTANHTVGKKDKPLADSPAAVFKIPKINGAAVLFTERGNGEENKEIPVPEEADSLKKNEVIATVQIPVFYERQSQNEDEEHSTQTNRVGNCDLINSQEAGDSLKNSSYALVDTIFRGIKRIEVKGEFCDVNVKTHSENYVILQGNIGNGCGDVLMLGRRIYKRKEYKLKFEKLGSLLKVWIESEKPAERVLIKGEVNEHSILNLTVPENMDMDIANSSGDIHVKDLTNKLLNFRTQFGDISVENIHSDLVLSSSSGNITANAITGDLKTVSSFGDQLLITIIGNIKLNSSSGNITVKCLTGNAEVHSSFGFQKFENITGNLVSVASSGDLIVKHLKGNASSRSSFGEQRYEDVEGDISSNASSGDIKIKNSKGVLTLGTSFGNITGKDVLLSSNSEFKTSSGDITLNLLNALNELSFDLQSSSGELVIEKDNVKNSSDKKLVLGQGAIRIKGVSSFGDQLYK